MKLDNNTKVTGLCRQLGSAQGYSFSCRHCFFLNIWCDELTVTRSVLAVVHFKHNKTDEAPVCFARSCSFREAMMTRSLRRLKEQIVRANLLAQEAGFFAEELNKKTEYLVTLQIPAANLDANRKVGVSTNARKRNGFIPS